MDFEKLALIQGTLQNENLLKPQKPSVEITPPPVMKSVTETPAIDQDVDQMTQELEEQSTSDEVNAIEQDLENTDLNYLDQEMEEILEELD